MNFIYNDNYLHIHIVYVQFIMHVSTVFNVRVYKFLASQFCQMLKTIIWSIV